MDATPMLIAATVSSSLLVGGILTLLPSLSGAAREHLRVPPGRELWLRLSFAVALVVALAFGGALVAAYGVRDILILGAVLSGFGLASLGLSRNLQTAAGSAALLGVAGGVLHAASATAMPDTFFGWERAPSATNLGYVFVALGAVLLPFLVRFVASRLGFRNGLLVVALIVLVPVVCTIAAGRGQFSEPRPALLLLLAEDFRLVLVALAVLFFSAAEGTTIQWATSYLRDIGFGTRGQRLLLVSFWALFLGSRLLASSLTDDKEFTWLVLILTGLALIVLGNMIGWHNRGSGGLGFVCVAPCLGPIFPTLVGLTFVIFPHQPAAVGLVCALGAVGQMTTEPLAQYHLSRNRIRLVMGASLILALLAALPVLVFLLRPTV